MQGNGRDLCEITGSAATMGGYDGSASERAPRPRRNSEAVVGGPEREAVPNLKVRKCGLWGDETTDKPTRTKR